MKTLFLLRHAKSSWKDPSLEDQDRPLNKRGKKDAPRVGKLMRKKGLMPDLIISSTAVRARKTVEAVAGKSKYSGKIHWDERLYMAGPMEIVSILREIEDPAADKVMMVGHNPGQEELIRELVGVSERLPTAALAQIELPIESWRDLQSAAQGKLVHLWRPKELES